MTTKVYGAGDDLIELEGDVTGERGHYADDDAKAGTLLAFSDGTMLDIQYGKPGMGIWAVTLLRAGALFAGIDTCTDEDAEPASDVANFKDGLKWCYGAAAWEKVT